MMDDSARNSGMFRQEVIQAVGPGHHQCLEPSRAAAIALPQAARIDEQSLTKIGVNGRLPFGQRREPQTIEVVALDAAEVILGLRIDHSEHRVRVGFAVDMRDAPVVADDANILGMLPPALKAHRTVKTRNFMAAKASFA